MDAKSCILNPIIHETVRGPIMRHDELELRPVWVKQLHRHNRGHHRASNSLGTRSVGSRLSKRLSRKQLLALQLSAPPSGADNCITPARRLKLIVPPHNSRPALSHQCGCLAANCDASSKVSKGLGPRKEISISAPWIWLLVLTWLPKSVGQSSTSHSKPFVVN